MAVTPARPVLTPAWQGVPSTASLPAGPRPAPERKDFVDGRKRPARGKFGTWVINLNGTPANDFAGATFMDSPAVFMAKLHLMLGRWALFSRKWIDTATVNYAKDSESFRKQVRNPPSEASTIHDITFVKHA